MGASRTHPLIRKASPSLSNPEHSSDYDEQRIAWARGLSEVNLRSLAVEYYKGARDETAIDAYKEYCRRFPNEISDSVSPTSWRARKSRDAQQG